MIDFKHNFEFLKEPLPITEHQWDDDVTQFVSISCTTYNHEPYIRDAIEGFLMQRTTFPVRIVIFEDCSTDNTAKIIKEYVAKYPNLFRAFCQPENTWGKPNRREAGKPFREERTKAKYIALCEGDDYWTDPLKLQKQVDFLEENEKYSFSCHNNLVFYEHKRRYTIRNKRIMEEVIDLKSVIFKRYYATASIVYRRESLSKRPSWSSKVS